MLFGCPCKLADVVIWSGTLEKLLHDAQTRPAPPLDGESRPELCPSRKEFALRAFHA